MVKSYYYHNALAKSALELKKRLPKPVSYQRHLLDLDINHVISITLFNHLLWLSTLVVCYPETEFTKRAEKSCNANSIQPFAIVHCYRGQYHFSPNVLKLVILKVDKFMQH